MIAQRNQEKITIVLNRPRVSENIGSVARAMMNMGFERLVVVAPENFDMEKASKTATHSAQEILDRMNIHESLGKALSPFEYVVGTTARLGGQRRVESPRTLAARVAGLSFNNQVALVFGQEDRGLSNGEISLCHALINIPTANFTSINLAQAVMIVCYELFMAGYDEIKNYVPRLASVNELDIMYGELSMILDEIGYVNPENPDFRLNQVRHFFSRIKLHASETSLIKGVIRQILLYGERQYQMGLLQKKRES